MNELIPVSYECAYCGEENDTLADPSGGTHQSYVEDCTVCCRPNVLQVSILPDGTAMVQASQEE